MRNLAIMLIAATCLCGRAMPAEGESYVVDSYDFYMRLKIPAIKNNLDSLGSRELKWQRIYGTVHIGYVSPQSEPVVWLDGLYNRDYKIGGKNVTYQPAVTKASLHAIGSNLTQKFKVVMPSMEMTLNPSYNIGDDEPDNTLILKLAGDGSAKKMTGYVTGDVGCGCYAYGHTSPTRIVYWPWVSSRYVSYYGRWFYPCVVDIAPTYGRFVMKFRERGCGPVELTDEDLDEDDGL